MIHFLTTWIWFLESVSSSVFHVSLTGSLLLRTFFFLFFLRFPPSPHLPPQQKAESESTDARCPTPRAESESTHLTCPTLRVQVAREQSFSGTPWQGFSERGRVTRQKTGPRCKSGANHSRITGRTQVWHILLTKNEFQLSWFERWHHPFLWCARLETNSPTVLQYSNDENSSSTFPGFTPTCLVTKPPTKRPRPMKITYPSRSSNQVEPESEEKSSFSSYLFSTSLESHISFLPLWIGSLGIEKDMFNRAVEPKPKHAIWLAGSWGSL